MQLENDRAAMPSDQEHNGDVSKQGAPIMGSLDDTDIELSASERAAHGKYVPKALGDFLEERLALPAPPPWVRFNRAATRPKRGHEMGCVLRQGPPNAGVLDEHEDAHQSRISRHHSSNMRSDQIAGPTLRVPCRWSRRKVSRARTS